MLHFLKSLLQLIMMPRCGWEDIESDSVSPDRVFTAGFLPLAAVSGLTVFIQMFYHAGMEIIWPVTMAIVEFVSYFIGYYIAVFALSNLLPAVADSVDRDRTRLLVLHAMGLMCLIGIVGNVMPSDFAIIYFMLIYVAIVLWRAADFMNIRQGKAVRFTVYAALAVILPPLIIQMLFGGSLA